MQPARSRRQPCRILLVAPNWLGDLVMTLPVLDWLAAARLAPGAPGFSLSVAVRAAWAPLLAGDQRLDSLLVTERPGAHAGLSGAARQAAVWRSGRFDAALLGPPSLRVAVVAAAAGIPLRIGHRGDLRSPLLSRALPRAPRGSRHFSQEMLDLARALARELGWTDAVVSAAEAAPPAHLAGVAAGARPAPGGRPLWSLGAGATFGPAKTWPPARAAEFVRAVAAAGGRVLVLGDESAAPLVAAIRAQTAGLSWARGEAAVAGEPGADVVDLAGATDLAGVVGWLRASAAYVGNDSGLMHLAAALGVATVGLFGSSNPDWTRPLGPRAVALAADGFACRPCYRRTCNQNAFCLDTIDGRHVHEVALALLSGGEGAAAAGSEGNGP
jgi:heptosyltransferase-2